MTGQHDARARHPIQEWSPEPERHDTAPERSEADRTDAGWNFALTWSSVKELAAIITIVLSCATTFYGLKAEIQEGHHDIEMVAARVALIERGRAENLPRLEEQIRNNAMQDQRIQNLAEAIASLRTTVADLTRIVAGQSDLIHEAHERQAVLEERLGHIGPHDR